MDDIQPVNADQNIHGRMETDNDSNAGTKKDLKVENKSNFKFNAESDLKNSTKNNSRKKTNDVPKIRTTSEEYNNCKHVCTCGNKYRFRRGLMRHVKKKHPNVRLLKPKRDTISKFPKCPICEEHLEKNDLKFHLLSKHGVELPKEELYFDNFADFEAWKKEIEKSTMSLYKKDRGAKNLKKGAYHRYECHRSGCYVPKGRGQRSPKFLGSSKTNRHCPAVMKVIECPDDSCEVEFVNVHLGHTNDIAHLPLTVEEKEALAKKLESKIHFNEILNEVRNSLPTDLQRIHLLDAQDLRNIRHRNGDSDEECRKKHSNDYKSVDNWINENSSCVLYYKAKGKEHNVLHSQDFALVLMNETQQELLRKYSNDGVCIDTISGITSHGFEMVSLFVLDNMGQGFPAAFLFSNHVSIDSLSVFFSSIKDKVGQIQPKFFIAGAENNYFNAWTREMLAPEKRLYGSWQVNSDWCSNLSKIECHIKHIEVHKRLKKLLEKRDVNAFKLMLKATVKGLVNDKLTADYGDYFYQCYAQCTEAWAYCYRLDSEININIQLERLHKTLEYICHHESQKAPEQLDKPINEVMQFVRFTVLDRLLALNPEKSTRRVKQLHDRHKRTEKMSRVIKRDEDGSYTVSFQNCKRPYRVRENISNCSCTIICPGCGVCLHRYVCICLESAVKWNMCIHIHLVGNFIKNTSPNGIIPEIRQTESSMSDDAGDYVNNDSELVITEELENSEPSSILNCEPMLQQEKEMTSDNPRNHVDRDTDLVIDEELENSEPSSILSCEPMMQQEKEMTSDDPRNHVDSDTDLVIDEEFEDGKPSSVLNCEPMMEQKKEIMKRKFLELIDCLDVIEQFEIMENAYQTLTNPP